MDRFTSPEHEVLSQIADALGVPVERFFTRTHCSGGPDDVSAYLDLLLRIRTSAGRQKALENLRVIVAEEEA